MKQYEIEIKFDPRSADDRFPWRWKIKDPDSHNRLYVLLHNRERRRRTAIRRAERAARKLLKEDREFEKNGNVKYLYPKYNSDTGF
jgi:hypothetical protein